MPSVLVSVRCFAPAAAVAAVVAATAGGSKPAVATPYLPFLSPSRVAVALFTVVSSLLPVLVSIPLLLSLLLPLPPLLPLEVVVPLLSLSLGE